MKMNYIKYVLSCVMLAMAAHVSAISVTVDAVNIEAGQSSEIIISLNNTETNLTAYQLSLYLPDGVTLHKKANGKYDYTLSNRHESTHTMSIKDAADGSLLLVCSSMDKDVISGTSGELLRLPIDVASTVTTSLQAQLKNMVFSDVNSQKSYPSDVTFNLQLAGEDPVVNPDDIAITIPDVSVTAGGSAEIVVSLTNSATNLTAYQMSLYLPAGVTLHKKANGKYDYTLSDRHENTHTLSIKDAADGSLLLVCSSMDKDVISGTSGELLRLPIDVASTVTTSLQAQLKNMVFSDVNSQKSYPSDVTFNLVLGGSISNNISFADPAVKALCVANWDSNGDGELSEAEAAAVTSLGDVFYNNKNITSFEELCYFTGLTSINSNAFYGCSGLTSVTIPNSVTSIGNQAFYYCTGLTSVIIPNSVTSIGNQAFQGCSGLTSVTIPNSVTSIGIAAFIDCSSLTTIVVESGNPIYDSRNDCNAIIETATNTLVTGCKNSTIPNSVTSIGSGAFYCCSGLTSMTIPNSVTSIGNYAFYFCSGLTSVTIPNSVTSIGGSAFWLCSSLTSVTIPNSVTSIGYGAFSYCDCLTSVIVENEIPLQIEPYTFSNRANATLYVPTGCKAAYEAADYWNEFKEIVEMGPASEPGDLNGDGIINGVDLVAQTNLIMTDQYNATADLNNDGVVNGLDYVIMVNLILSETSAPAMQAAGSNRVAPTSSLSIENFDIKAGETKEMYINLSNPDMDLTLLQFDLRLPDGLSIAKEDGDYAIDIAGRTTWKKHSLMAKATNGITRFLLASNSNALIDGDNGKVISIKLTASDDFTCGDIMLENQLLVTPDAEDVMPADFIYSVGSTTSIDAIMAGQPVDVYTLTGTKVVSGATSIKDLPKGIYIIKGKKAIVK